jgi:hypothetical protein
VQAVDAVPNTATQPLSITITGGVVAGGSMVGGNATVGGNAVKH